MHASSARWTNARLLARSVALCLLAAAAVAGLGGCTHASGAPPVDSPVYQFQPVDPDDYADDTDDDEADDDADSGDDATDDAE